MQLEKQTQLWMEHSVVATQMEFDSDVPSSSWNIQKKLGTKDGHKVTKHV